MEVKKIVQLIEAYLKGNIDRSLIMKYADADDYGRNKIFEQTFEPVNKKRPREEYEAEQVVPSEEVTAEPPAQKPKLAHENEFTDTDVDMDQTVLQAKPTKTPENIAESAAKGAPVVDQDEATILSNEGYQASSKTGSVTAAVHHAGLGSTRVRLGDHSGGHVEGVGPMEGNVKEDIRTDAQNVNASDKEAAVIRKADHVQDNAVEKEGHRQGAIVESAEKKADALEDSAEQREQADEDRQSKKSPLRTKPSP